MRWTASETGPASWCRTKFLGDPTSLVAAEIHLGRRSVGFSDEPTAVQHSSCVPAGDEQNIDIFQGVPKATSKL
jgi:hypothetical protein